MANVSILFSTTDAVRSCLGLDLSDLSDEMISSQNLKTRFQMDLGSWYVGSYVDHWTASGYDPLDDAADQEIADTPSEDLLRGMRLSIYSMWFAAFASIDTMLTVTEKTSDGKNEVSRLRSIDFNAIREIVKGNLETAKSEILEDLAPTTNTLDEPLVPVSSDFGSYNPITGV